MDQLLLQIPLFAGIGADRLPALLHAMRAERRRYTRGESIFHMGAQTGAMGVVLSGSVTIAFDDIWGNHSILGCASRGELFAETYAMLQTPMMVQVMAQADTEVLFLHTQALFQRTLEQEGTQLLQNLLHMTAQKNLNLSRRMQHTSSKLIRGRLLSYLSFQASMQGSCEITIPFNRQQLADYLSVERSALSNEISKMQREGLLRTERNCFWLHPEAKSGGFPNE